MHRGLLARFVGLVFFIVLIMIGISSTDWVGAAPDAASVPNAGAEKDQRLGLESTFRETYGQRWQIAWDEARGCVRSLNGRYATGVAIGSEEMAKTAVFNFLEGAKDLLKVTPSDLKSVRANYSSFLGRYRVDFQQYYGGLRVETGEIRVSIRKDGTIYAVRNGCYSGINVSSVPRIGQDDAVAIARDLYSFPTEKEPAPSTELVVFPAIDDSLVAFCLAWKIGFHKTAFFIDADQGNVVGRWQNLKDEVTYSGRIRGTTLPLTDPTGASLVVPLEYVYVWLDESSPAGGNEDGETSAAGNYSVTVASPVRTLYTRLQSDKVRVENSQIAEIEHTYVYRNKKDFVHNYDFPDSPGNEANVYFNIIQAWNSFSNSYGHHQPLITAVANDIGLTIPTYGSSSGTQVWYRPEAGRYSSIIQHEFTHCVVYNMNGNQWINTGGVEWDCLDEAFAWYYPCAFNGSSHFIGPAGYDIDIATLIVIEDLNAPLGTLDEADHSHYHNQKAVAAAWWELRGSLGESHLHTLLWTGLDNLQSLSDRRHPRDFFNEMLIADDDDGDPKNGTPHLNSIAAAYTNHGMNYWPGVESVAESGDDTDDFGPGQKIYCRGWDLPTNQEVRIYVVQHNPSWANDASLTDVTGGYETATTDGSGDFPATVLWTPSTANIGDYDIVVDVDRDGAFDFDFDGIIDASDGLNDVGFRVKGELDVALILDRSGSMGTTDKLPRVKAAANYFVDKLRKGEQIAISAFCDYGTLVAPLTYIPDENPTHPVKTSLKSVINNLTADGMTNFGIGLQIAYNQLNTSPIQEKYAIFMSNGQHNTGTYGSQVAAFKSKGWPIYTIAFGSDANQTTLRGIASETGGAFFSATTTDVQSIYDLIQILITGRSILAALQGWINLGQTILQSVAVPSSASWVGFSLFWPGSDMDLVLIAPDGTLITPEVAAADPNISYTKASTYAFYSITNPMAGEWNARITGTSVPSGGSEYNLNVSTSAQISSNFLSFLPFYNLGDPVLTRVSLREKVGGIWVPILGAGVDVDVIRPNGAVDSFALRDNGAGGDELASDGIYSGVYTNASMYGSYFMTATATGTASSGPFSAQLTRNIQVGPYAQISIAANSLRPVPNSSIEDTQPTIGATIAGPTANIDASSIQLSLDGTAVPHSYDVVNQTISYVPPDPLSGGIHDVNLRVSDMMGNPCPVTGWSFTVSSPALPAILAFHPGVLNPRSDGRWVTCYIELPAGYNPEQIDVSTVKFNETVAAEMSPTEVGDYDQDGVLDRMVKFSRSAVIDTLPYGEYVEVRVSGAVGSQAFASKDTIRVLMPKLVYPNGGQILQVGKEYTLSWQVPRGYTPGSYSIFYTTDDGNSWNAVAENKQGISCTWVVPVAASASCRILVEAYDNQGPMGYDVSDKTFAIASITTARPRDVIPISFDLRLTSLNPSVSGTTLQFDLPEACYARVTVFDVVGRFVRELVNESRPAGSYPVQWDAKNVSGHDVPPGIYFIHVRAGSYSVTRKIMLLR